MIRRGGGGHGAARLNERLKLYADGATVALFDHGEHGFRYVESVLLPRRDGLIFEGLAI